MRLLNEVAARDGRAAWACQLWFTGKALAIAAIGLCLAGGVCALAQNEPILLERNGRTIALEPYAPNIVRITLSNSKAGATASPGYGFLGTPASAGWHHEQEADGSEILRSARLVLHLSADHLPASRLPQRMPLDAINQSLRDHYFGKGGSGGPNEDDLAVTTTTGKTLLECGVGR